MTTTGGARDEEKLFLGKKERRRSSAHKVFQGDYLGLSKNTAALKLLAKCGDSAIKFTDFVVKVNKRMKMQERILMITDSSLYNLDPNNYKIKRRILIRTIGMVSASTLADNFFILHIPHEYDYLFISNKKTEIIVHLMALYEKVAGKPLQVQLDNRIEYKYEKASNSLPAVIQFQKSEGGVTTQITKREKGNKMTSTIN